MAKAEAATEKPLIDIPLMPWETSGSKVDSQESAAEALLELAESEDEDTPAPKSKSKPERKARSEPEEDVEEDEPEEEDESDDEEDDSADEDEEDSDDEDEEDDSEEDPDEDEDPDDDDEEELEDELFEVKVDGKKQRVTRDELIKGYSRTADYTRKTQEVAKIREKAESETLEARKVREQFVTQIEALEELLTELRGDEPDWDKIRKEKPAEFATIHAEWNLKQEQIKNVAANKEKVQREQQKDLQAKYEEHLATEREKLIEVVPEFKDPDKGAALSKAIIKYARDTFGITKEQLANMADHRIFVLLKKAMERDTMESTGKTKLKGKVKKAAPVLKPGARVDKPKAKSSVKRKARAQASQRLVKSGDPRDAAILFQMDLDES
jgi:hypothetical protein